MPQGATLRVDGYREFLRACDNAGKDTKKFVRATYRTVGDIVKVDAAGKLPAASSHSTTGLVKAAAGYRTVVRARGVEVDQTLKRSGTKLRQRPRFSHYQMKKALTPALEENEDRTVREFARAMDKVCDHFERKP